MLRNISSNFLKNMAGPVKIPVLMQSLVTGVLRNAPPVFSPAYVMSLSYSVMTVIYGQQCYQRHILSSFGIESACQTLRILRKIFMKIGSVVFA